MVLSMAEGVVPSAGTLWGVAVNTKNVFGKAVWAMVVLPLRPPCASVAVTVHVPAVVEARYVMLEAPLAFVLLGLAVVKTPHAAPPLVVKLTGSLRAADPLALMTVAVTVDVVRPSAGTLDGL